MQVIEFKDGYPDNTSFPVTMLLNAAIGRVLTERGEGEDTELTLEVLHAVYLAIAQDQVKPTAEELILAVMQGEDPKEMALKVIDGVRHELTAV